MIYCNFGDALHQLSLYAQIILAGIFAIGIVFLIINEIYIHNNRIKP